MGNTNLPQAGAAHAENSRDTLSGGEQLSEPEKSPAGQRDTSRAEPSSSNMPERSARQLRDSDEKDGETRARNDSLDQPAPSDGEARPAAFVGHANTGHSPSDAT